MSKYATTDVETLYYWLFASQNCLKWSQGWVDLNQADLNQPTFFIFKSNDFFPKILDLFDF